MSSTKNTLYYKLFHSDESYFPSDIADDPTFQSMIEADIYAVFVNLDEYAETHTVDGSDVRCVITSDMVKTRSAHWEGGAKQSFDTGLYKSDKVLYIKVSDYGKKPKIGKPLRLDNVLYDVGGCEEACGLFRISLDRTRQ